MEISPPDDQHVWQIRAGNKKKFWKTLDDAHAEILEGACRRGAAYCELEFDGWLYRCDMNSYVLTSVRTGAQRPFRRILYSTACSNTGDEDWD